MGGDCAQSVHDFLVQPCCTSITDYEVRIVQGNRLLRCIEQLDDYSKLAHSSLRDHVNLLLTKARQGGLSSGGKGMENSMWPLYERIIRLHSLQVDFFAAAVYDIQLVIPLTQSTPFTKEISSIITNISRPEDILRFADDPDDYSPLVTIIESLDNALSISESFRSPLVEEIRKNIQTIRKCFVVFLEAFARASVHERQAMMSTKAQISGIGLHFFTLEQPEALKLLCRSEQGQIRKENTSGSHAVCHREGIFYKANPEGRGFINPGAEFAVYSVYQMPDTPKE